MKPVSKLLMILFSVTGFNAQAQEGFTPNAQAIDKIIQNAKRVPNSTGWFEVLKLPNRVYAFWEPGHVEKVNSFLILGEHTDLLYDTGMGIAKISLAIEEVRRHENLPAKPIMVVNSHNHLDHNGGNSEFDQVWIANEPWGVKRLTTGVPAGVEGGFVGYWDQLVDHKGVKPPEGFSPYSHAIPPYPEDQIGFLSEGGVIELGDRDFEVIRTFSHSPDGIALFDRENGIFFGGDTFYGADYLVTDISLLAKDLERIEKLDINWHHSSHGLQLVTAMQQGKHLIAVTRIMAGGGEESTTSFAGFELPIQALDGVTVTVAAELLLY